MAAERLSFSKRIGFSIALVSVARAAVVPDRALRPRLVLAWAFFLAAVSNSAAGELCFCSNESFAWQGCAAGAAACDAAGWQGCTASPDDSFEIRAGCQVTVAPGDDVLLDQDASADVKVADGGRLTLAGPVEWRVGPSGMKTDSGSAIEFGGCYRRFAGSGPACAPALDASGVFQIGRVIPCRDGDCADDAHLVRIAWPDDGSLPPETLAEIDAFLAGLDVARDVLCFWQTSEDGYVGADAGYCYKVAARGAGSGVRFLDFDVRQIWNAQSDQAGYPLARREVIETTLQGDHAIHSRTLHFADTAAIQTRTDQMGRWIRCGGSQRAYLIASVTDDAAGDAVLLADANGIRAELADGTRCHIDWGWAAGDYAFVMAPVHVTSSVNQIDAAYLDLGGAVDWNGVVVDGLGGTEGRGGVQIRGGPLLRFSHVWVTDPLSSDNEAILFDRSPVRRVGLPPHDHGRTRRPRRRQELRPRLVWRPHLHLRAPPLLRPPPRRRQLRDPLPTADPTGKIVWRWVQAGPSSAPGDSGQFLDFGTGNVVDVDGQDGLCTACTSQDGFGSLIIPSGGGSGLMRNLLWVGVFNGGVDGGATDQANPNFQLKNVGVIGSAVDPNQPRGVGSLAGLDTDGFYVRDVVDPRPFPMQLCNANPYGNFVRRLSHGVFLGVSLGATPCEVGEHARLEDVYFLDIARSGAGGPLLAVLDTASDVQLRRVTIGFRSEPTGLTQGLSIWPWLANGALTLDGPLLTGFRGAGVQAMSIGNPANAAQIAWQHPTCFADNDVDDTDEALAAYGVPPLHDVDPLFVAPELLRFDLAAGSPARDAGCGAGVAGIATRDWAHRKTKLTPIYMGPPRAPGWGALGAESALAPLMLIGLRWARGRTRRIAIPQSRAKASV